MIWSSLRIAASLIAGCLVVCLAGCERTTASPATPPAAAAAASPTPIKLVAEGGDTYNFGTVEKGEEFEHVFVIKNVSEKTVSIFAGPPSCTTCTSFKLDKNRLDPNETAKATVKWRIVAETTQFRQHAPIMATMFEETPKPVIKLFVEGKVTRRIIVNPSVELWAVGDTKEGEPTEFEGSVVSPIVDSFQVDSITTTNPAMTVTATPLSKEKLEEYHSKSGYALKATITPDISVGMFKEKVLMKLLVPDPVTFNIDVTARRTGPIHIFGENWDDEKALLTIPSFDIKQGFTARLNLFTRGVKEELTVKRIVCADSRVTAEIKPDPKFKAGTGERRKYDLFVKIAPTDRAIVYTLHSPLVVQLQTNQPLVGEVQVRLRCQALP